MCADVHGKACECVWDISRLCRHAAPRYDRDEDMPGHTRTMTSYSPSASGAISVPSGSLIAYVNRPRHEAHDAR